MGEEPPRAVLSLLISRYAGKSPKPIQIGRAYRSRGVLKKHWLQKLSATLRIPAPGPSRHTVGLPSNYVEILVKEGGLPERKVLKGGDKTQPFGLFF